MLLMLLLLHKNSQGEAQQTLPHRVADRVACRDTNDTSI